MDRKTYRENAFKMLFSIDFRNDESFEEFYINYLEENNIKDDVYLKKVFFGVLNNIEVLDELINNNLNKWKLSRLSKITLVILRLASYEMKECEDIPFAVSINEAVELSKIYDEESSAKFVNGILNSIACELGLK